jgi:hypothetical protein
LRSRKKYLRRQNFNEKNKTLTEPMIITLNFEIQNIENIMDLKGMEYHGLEA